MDFAGWEMPVQYASILDEVRVVRSAVGLFDLSHMGRVSITGPDALALVDRVATNWCSKIPVGAIRYALLCKEDGYPIDDLLLYREGDGSVFTVVNASNHDADLAWLRKHADGLDVSVNDHTDELAMIALQGPNSQAALQPHVTECDLGTIKYYRFGFGTVSGIEGVRISRTGYTGEDGFEVYLPAGEAARVWGELLSSSESLGMRPIGLGARDTLRLEAGMPLYGHEIDATHDPIAAGLEFGMRFDEERGDWVGRDALLAMKANPTRRIVGVTTPGKRAPRQGYALMDRDERVGEVCSGGISPTLDTNIGSASVRIGWDEAGRELELDVKGRRQPATVCELPFYSRTRK